MPKRAREHVQDNEIQNDESLYLKIGRIIMAKPMLIGIAGGTGSGKSTFADGLKKLFSDDITIISYDNYYKAQDS